MNLGVLNVALQMLLHLVLFLLVNVVLQLLLNLILFLLVNVVFCTSTDSKCGDPPVNLVLKLMVNECVEPVAGECGTPATGKYGDFAGDDCMRCPCYW